MSNQQFLGGLRVMDKRGGFTDRSDEWHETVCRYLNINIPRPYGRFNWDILDLCILPLADGTWGRAASASECCFPTELDLSHLVGLKFISPKVRPGTLRYAFLEALGVRPANAVVVANHILQSNKMYALSDMVRFAHFFYSHQDDRGFPSPSGLAVMDANENKTTGNELYLDATMADGGSLRSILPNARFIHAAYAPPSVYQASSWRKWLREHLGVHIRPRVIYGKLSPEFRMMTQTLSELETPRRLLGVLQEYWPFISQELSRDGLGELSATAVTCVDGVRRKLAETALHRRALRMAQIPPQSLHFIDVSNPDDPRWDFLQTLGVMVEPNAIAWLEVLKRLQATELLPAAMISAVEEAYKQLNARFNEASDEIRQTFRDHPLLLLISGDRDNMSVTWTGMSSAYWEGPSYLSDVLIKHSYPYLRDFFVDKLGLPTGAPPRAVIDRLLQITQTYVDMELQKSVHDVVERILLDVAEWCAKPPRNMQVTSELKRLQNKAIFPVLTTEGTIMLRSVDRFYVRRSSLAQLEKLEGRIPLLVTTPRLRIPDIEPLLDSEIWSTPVKYLEPPVIEIQHKPEGDLELSMALRERYTEPFRLQCIRSTICHTLGSRARQRDSKELIFAGKLSSMTIGTVGAIVETISLPAEDVSHVTQLASHLEETDEGLRILVARTTIEDADEKIIGQLSQRLGIDLCRMFMYMKSPRKDVLRILKLEGIDITSADYVEDNDSFPWDQYQEWQSTPSSAPSASIARSRASDLSRGGTRLENSFTSQLTVSERRSRSDATETQERQSLAGQVHDAMRNLEECLGSISLDTGAVYATDSLENSPLEIDLSSLVTSLSKPRSSALVTAAAGSTQTRRDTSGLSAITSTPSDWALETASADAPDGTLSGSRALNTGTTSTIASIFTSLATSVAAIDDVSDYQIVNGILGERYAYAVLSKLLGPSFGPDNWTSELRGQVPGFTYYEGNPLADFRCPDDNGVLTGRWYGEEVKKRWEPEWPTYHVEVKSTSRSREEPFHMKRAQLRTALQLTAQSESLESPPKHVYILMRVSGIRSGRPTHMVFIDPHRWIYKGALVIESDIEVSVDVNALPTT
ncbi:uncharacterized protein B0H18DRAFT_1000819 [Fomitopsis serialis]|uniref:uncharacterized protein n=1 Tax=Fomitopsis serialis TaxID=139415 RepID=UPI0020077075|nr:uncharacterized protein B0H18DRAFT_1000819 [Neoantrodia serialis]KAH9928330.1 hypothetical protein B0H18DRAFT_1000819 [Neoantrodia serialis]